MLEQDRLRGLEKVVIHHVYRTVTDISNLFADGRIAWEGTWLKNNRTERSEMSVKFVT